MNQRKPEKISLTPDGRPLSEQPVWRQDFPIDWPEDQYVARRDFTKFLGLTSLAFVMGQFWIVVENWSRRGRGLPPLRAIAQLDEVPVGGSKTFHYPEETDPCLLLRPSERSFLAYDQKCTHLSCAVIPEMSQGQLRCPCHHGYFEMATGRPLAGPPRRPLPRITLEIRDGIIYATGIERRMV